MYEYTYRDHIKHLFPIIKDEEVARMLHRIEKWKKTYPNKKNILPQFRSLRDDKYDEKILYRNKY